MSEIVRIRVPVPYPVGSVNSYYVADSVPALIDTGVHTAEALDAVASAVHSHGATLAEIKRIIVTHGHGDHMGLAGRIAEAGDAEIFAHLWDLPAGDFTPGTPWPAISEPFFSLLVESGAPEGIAKHVAGDMVRRVKSMFGPVPAVSPLSDGQIFEFDDFDLEVLHTPGHSPGSVCLFARESGTLFAGDCLLEEITCNPAGRLRQCRHTPPYRALAAYHSSLNLVEQLPVNQVLPGHGAPYSEHRQRISKLRDHHEQRRRDVPAALHTLSSRSKARGAAPYSIASTLFPSMQGVEIFYRICATTVHLDALEDEGMIFSELKNGTRVCCLSDSKNLGTLPPQPN